jgi:hypothetical protein
MTVCTFWRGITKNSSFLRLWPFFVSYCPQFWGAGVIYKARDTQYILERHDQKLILFVFMAIFVSYCPQFWDAGVIYKA